MDANLIEQAAQTPPPDSAPARDIPPVSTYDQVPYSISAFPQTRPDRLATIATLFGMKPTAPAHCRVLELGCASGGNLIPMAFADPQSHFVGIDLSGRQISDGQAVVRELQLPNVDLRHLSITDVTGDLGQFDYILAHGVYSWVPPQVQEKILDICNHNLAPQGVAYVSYNCFPGWHARAAIREMLWYHAERFDTPAKKVRAARGLLAFLIHSTPHAQNGFGTLMRQEMAILQRTPDTYLLHEHLEEFNEPLYFNEFAQRAAGKQLQYLGEAAVSLMLPSTFGAETEQLLREVSPDLLHMEQYMDFLRNRMFRQTLLCHVDVKLDHSLRPEAIQAMYIACDAKPAEGKSVDIASAEPQQFIGSGKKTLSTQDPIMKAAMTILYESWPVPIRFDALLAAARKRSSQPASPDDARQLATRLLNCYSSALLELSMSPAAFINTVSEKPLASPYARLRAREGGKVVNLRLEAIQLGQPSSTVLSHLDGQHDRAALIELVKTLLQSAPAETGENATAESPVGSPDERARAYVDQVLAAFARSALLVG